MKKIILVLALLSVSFVSNAGKVISDSVHSNILNADVKYNVYLPDGFENGEKTYPVIYLLHGLWGNYQDWEKLGRMSLVADEMIGSGELVPAVIVMPNAGGPSKEDPWYGYFNLKGWNYEDFFFNEFIPQIEKRYRCIADKGHRAIMGLSMGGGGSVVYCQHHPQMFSSCYAMSAWLEGFPEYLKNKKDVSPKVVQTCNSVVNNSALEFIAKADVQTLEALNTVKWTFDCGDDDDLLPLSVNMHFAMKEKGVNSELRVRNGIHNFEYWHQALRLALPFASRNFVSLHF